MRWEVRTMRFATSCSKTLIRSDWRRFWPVGFLYALFSFFALPLPLWVGGQNVSAVLAEQQRELLAERVFESIPVFVLMNFFLGLAVAMAVYAYLMSGKSVGLMHALPVSRDRQFLSHFAAGLSMLTAANCLTFLMALLMEAVTGCVEPGSLLLWLVITELIGFFFLAFATLAVSVTGWLLAVPVIYVGFNFVVWAYWMILQALAGILYPSYGSVFSYGGAVEWLTPVVRLMRVTTDRYGPALRVGTRLYDPGDRTLSTVLIYAAAGVVMLALAWLLYRKRHSETAGDAIAFRPLRPVARYVISIAAGLALGTMIYEMVTWGGRDVVALILWQLAMGALAYCAVEMLLRKSFRIFDRRTAVGLLALWLVLAGTCLAMKWDITGYEKRVPAAEQVQAVEVNGIAQVTLNSEDPETVQAVIDLHRALMEQREPENPWGRCSVQYTLKNGSTMEREYRVDLEDGPARRTLTALLNRPEIRQALLVEDYGEYGEQFTGGYAVNYVSGQELVLTPGQCLTLYRALEADMEMLVSPEQLDAAYRSFDLELNTTEGTYHIWRLFPNCANTLAVLQNVGLIESPEELANW